MEPFLCPESSSKQTIVIVTIITGVTPVTLITALWAGLGRMLICHTLPADMDIHVIHYHVFMFIVLNVHAKIRFCWPM